MIHRVEGIRDLDVPSCVSNMFGIAGAAASDRKRGRFAETVFVSSLLAFYVVGEYLCFSCDTSLGQQSHDRYRTSCGSVGRSLFVYGVSSVGEKDQAIHPV